MKYFQVFFLLVFLLSASPVSAQVCRNAANQVVDCVSSSATICRNAADQITDCVQVRAQAQADQSSANSAGSITLMNPLGEDATLLGFFADILAVLLVFAVPLIVFFIIFAGFKYVMAQGNPDEIATANRMLLYVVIGGLIILGANIILAVLKGTIDAFVI